MVFLLVEKMLLLIRLNGEKKYGKIWVSFTFFLVRQLGLYWLF